jgi:hypothetical protein
MSRYHNTSSRERWQSTGANIDRYNNEIDVDRQQPVIRGPYHTRPCATKREGKEERGPPHHHRRRPYRPTTRRAQTTRWRNNGNDHERATPRYASACKEVRCVCVKRARGVVTGAAAQRGNEYDSSTAEARVPRAQRGANARGKESAQRSAR